MTTFAGVGQRRVRLGTRGSALARVQSGLVAAELRMSGVEVEIVTVVTEGDVRPPDTAWGEGAFVGALEEALLAGRVDLAVHSAKDVPIVPESALVVAAYPQREDARDALVLPAGLGHGQHRGDPRSLLPAGGRVGTDSPRRSAFLRVARPDLRIVPLHGNVDTRLRRLDAGDVDALVLAIAGLVRLGRADRVTAALDPDLFPPAPGQGALAVQCRADDAVVLAAVRGLDHAETRACVTAERRVLAETGGGCRAPLGALAAARDGSIALFAAAVGEDGRVADARGSGPLGDADALARAVARELIAKGFRQDAKGTGDGDAAPGSPR